MFEKKASIKETDKREKTKLQKKGMDVIRIVLVPLLITAALVAALYLVMDKITERDTLLKNVVVASKNLRVNAYITPDEVDEYFKVISVDGAAVSKDAYTSMDDLKEASAFALGCPAMGAEVLEEGEMEPFVTEVEAFAAGKKIGLFGSYGWGDGQWMRDWEDRMKAAGATVVGGEGVICQETPDDDALANCKALGKELAALA